LHARERLVVFDMDGVLVDSNGIHADAFAAALERFGFEPSGGGFEGLPTKARLEGMGVPADLARQVDAAKQAATIRSIECDVYVDADLVGIFYRLTQDGFQIAVASNARRETVRAMLDALGLRGYVHHIFSHEDVEQPKPHPEIYLRAMLAAGVGPKDTLVVEDSPTGQQAAYASGARVLVVENRAGVTEDRIRKALRGDVKPPKIQAPDLTVLIPMAGAGSRFESAGYTFPKPLIDVNGKPMIQLVVESLNLDAKHVFIVQRQHRERYALDHLLNLIAPGCEVLEVDGVTEGAACTALLARDLIDNDNELLISNSDQFIDGWRSEAFLYFMRHDTDLAGAIPTFEATHPKWSFVATDVEGYITEVAEKRPISDQATAGIYFWRHGRDFVAAADQMIAKNVRVNGEFYIAPTYNEAIASGLRFRTWFLNQGMWGLGTPEDLQAFLGRSA
jgi:HAD superfamily hydrolase (TIGR01509 family)